MTAFFHPGEITEMTAEDHAFVALQKEIAADIMRTKKEFGDLA